MFTLLLWIYFLVVLFVLLHRVCSFLKQKKVTPEVVEFEIGEQPAPHK